MEDQPHSTYASQIFQKIMTEILPYINVFPDTDAETSPLPGDGALPEQEGITSETESSSQGEAGSEESGAEETTGQAPTMEDGNPIPDEYLNPSEEYVNREEGDDGSNLPAALPTEETTAQ